VASEAARQLSIEGQDVRFILFDTAMPGFPGLLRERRVWVDGARRQWHRLWTSDHPGLTRNLLDIYRRLLWSAVVLIRKVLLPFEDTPLIRWTIQWIQSVYYPVYKPHPLDAPLLHFLSADEPAIHGALDAACRFKWRTIARGGIDEEYLAFDHYNIFHEFNMPKIAAVLKRWCGTRAAGGIEIQHQTKLSSR
jgi:thioesterase domain-containing protein